MSTPTAAEAAPRTYARQDGRTALEIRGKEMKLSDMTDFDGSSWYAQGQTAVMVSIHGPTLAKNEAYDTCLLRVCVHHARALAPSAGGAERVIYDEKKHEVLAQSDAFALESLLESALDAVVLRDRFPRCVLVVDVLILQDEGSLPAVAVNAVMCALLDAGVPCRTTMAAVCVAALTYTANQAEQASSSITDDYKTNHSDGASSLPIDSTAKAETVFEYLLDPTHAEERLGSTYTASYTGSADQGSLTGSSSVGSLLGRTEAAARQLAYGCAGTGVFIFSNPSCGGGLLGQLVTRHGAGGLSVRAYGEMVTLAERASGVFFEFFRQCNVAN